MKNCDYYKILYDDVIVGALMVLKKEEQHYECCGLFVDPEYHNRGIATMRARASFYGISSHSSTICRIFF